MLKIVRFFSYFFSTILFSLHAIRKNLINLINYVVCVVGVHFKKETKSCHLNFPKPPNFPSEIPLELRAYENWSNQLIIQNLWFATPSNDRDVVALANWACANNFTLRASGFRHNWSPLTVTEANKHEKNVILIETRTHLKHMKVMVSPYPNTKAVTVGTGVSLLELLTFLEENGLGMYAPPAIGCITVGGILAIGGHGTSVPALGEKLPPAYSLGSISNLVISLTAVVWNPLKNAYVLKTFKRSEADTKAFLVNLGRTFITEVTLMVGPNYNIRCESRFDIPCDELFADPANVTENSRSLSRYLDETGRIETTLFPFANTAWLKIWSFCPNKPSSLLTKKVNRPYNYLVPNSIPKCISTIAHKITNSLGFLHQILGPAQYFAAIIENFVTLRFDIWGASKNIWLHISGNTLRQTACGYAVITKRANVQKVISQISSFHKNLLKEYAKLNLYPVNGVIDLRVSSLDLPNDAVPDGETPTLSAIGPVPGHPEFDTAIWISILSFDYGPYLGEAYQKIEKFMFESIDGEDAAVRAEWSKGYAYTKEGAWSNDKIIKDLLPSKYPGWNFTISTLDKYDPHRIFTNEFLNNLLVKV